LGHVLHKKGKKHKYEFNSITDPTQFTIFFMSDFINIAGFISEKIFQGRGDFKGVKDDFNQMDDNTFYYLPERFTVDYLI
jgi:hypothetical protein